MLLNLAWQAYFTGRVQPGVKVAGYRLEGLELPAARQQLLSQSYELDLSLKVGEQLYQPTPKELGSRLDTGSILTDATQSSWLPLSDLTADKSLGLAYSWDETKLSAYVDHLATTNLREPVDAAVIIEGGQARIQPDRPGLGYDRAYLLDAIKTALGSGASGLEIQPHAVPAQLKAGDLATNIEAAQRLMATSLVLTYQGRTFRPNPATIGSWLVFPKEGPGQVLTAWDEGRIRGYLQTVARQIDIAPVNRRINLVNGEVKSEEPGQEGMAIDQSRALVAITSSLAAGSGLTLELTTHSVAYKTQYNNTISLDGKYIEVNLSLQRLWVYQDHQLVYSTPITSGAAGAGFPTVTGLYSIYTKERNRYLDGRPYGWNYNVYVKYWMPFYRDYGLHDASWRSSFGGSDYYYGGSHGCVNMPEAAAAWIWDFAPVGTPVWTHH